MWSQIAWKTRNIGTFIRKLSERIHDLERARRAEARNILRIKGLHSCLSTRCQNQGIPK
jgi:hypothetical protein